MRALATVLLCVWMAMPREAPSQADFIRDRTYGALADAEELGCTTRTIAGRVTCKGKPLSKAVVCAWPGTRDMYTAVTDARGRYRLVIPDVPGLSIGVIKPLYSAAKRKIPPKAREIHLQVKPVSKDDYHARPDFPTTPAYTTRLSSSDKAILDRLLQVRPGMSRERIGSIFPDMPSGSLFDIGTTVPFAGAIANIVARSERYAPDPAVLSSMTFYISVRDSEDFERSGRKYPDVYRGMGHVYELVYRYYGSKLKPVQEKEYCGGDGCCYGRCTYLDRTWQIGKALLSVSYVHEGGAPDCVRVDVASESSDYCTEIDRSADDFTSLRF